jgi:hypothetical protein
MNKSETILNRLQITGNLDEKTPLCVVKEILEAHNLSSVRLQEKDIKFETLQQEIQKLNSYRPLVLQGSTEDNLRYISTFVNPNCKTWTKGSLLKAYTHLLSFPKENPSILSSIQYTQKDRDNIEGYNACMLYSICKNYSIDTNWKMTGNQMALLLQKLSFDSTKLRNGLIPLLESLTKSQLVNIYALLDQSSKKKGTIELLPENAFLNVKNSQEVKAMVYLDNDKLIKCFRNFNDTNYLLTSMTANNHFEAIVLAAMIYKLNIIESKFPLYEYEELSSVKSVDLYVPIDNNFRKKFLWNKSWYNIYHHWIPELTFLYSEKDMKNFCIQEGYDSEDFRNYDMMNLLHLSRISLNIYTGKNVYNFEQDLSPVNLDTLSEFINSECITIGILNDSNTLKTYTLSELANIFMNSKNYNTPENKKEVFSERVIQKIKTISSNSGNIELIKSISIVEKWKQYSNEFSESLRDIYSKNPSIFDFLTKTMEAAMYMRGWKVISEVYPLNEKETKLINSDLQFEIEKNVYSKILEIQNWFKEIDLNEIEMKVLKTLPLMKFSYEGDTKIFIMTPDPEDGTSILHRLEIVLGGDKHKNMKSCIRLTSNILLHSVYFYICSLGLQEPYNIFELEHIS